MNISRFFLGVKALFQSFFSFTPAGRYEARHGLVTGFAEVLGFRVHNRHLKWISDSEYLKYWNSFKSKDSSKIHERRFQMYYLAKSVESLPGDTVECGVWFGASSFMIMKASSKADRTHHIFDSFQGLSEPDERDYVFRDSVMRWKKGDLSIPEKVVEDNLRGEGRFKLYKGWIPDKFNEVCDNVFCFVHIDVDLYQPTYDSIAFFYERLTPGGIILCDDYGFETCPGAFDSMNDFFADKPEKIIHLTTGQGLVIKK